MTTPGLPMGEPGVARLVAERCGMERCGMERCGAAEGYFPSRISFGVLPCSNWRGSRP